MRLTAPALRTTSARTHWRRRPSHATRLLESSLLPFVERPQSHHLDVLTVKGVAAVSALTDLLDQALIERHSLNSTDAAILQAFLRYAAPLRGSAASVLVASDHRLLRAAKAQGLEVLDPEIVSAADIPAFLAAL